MRHGPIHSSNSSLMNVLTSEAADHEFGLAVSRKQAESRQNSALALTDTGAFLKHQGAPSCVPALLARLLHLACLQ